MAMHASGIRDTSKVLGISAVTVILTLRIWFRTILESNFDGTYEHVIIDEFWSFVGKRKEQNAGFGWLFVLIAEKYLVFK
jgi:hypothetical protein